VLLYRDKKPERSQTPPAWLVGAANLQRRDLGEGATAWAIGEAYLVGDRTDWRPLADGYDVALLSPFNPQDITRDQRWARTCDATDLQGRTWSAPVISGPDGTRHFAVAYGEDYLPALTPDQLRAVAITQAARDALLSDNDAGMDMSMACRWTAELLTLTHHLTMEILGKLCLIDDALALSVLGIATSQKLKVEP
jgi:hypothetical protein